MPTRDTLIFIHGLWMTGAESHWLRRRLETRFGFRTSSFGYRAVSEPLEQVLGRLRQQVMNAGVERFHVVGHSLGGLIGFRFFEHCADLPPGRVVFLGSPLAGSLAAKGLERFAFGRRMVGSHALEQLRGEPTRRWTQARELGVIAGTRPMGFGRLFAGFDEPNDGTVAVRETRIEGITDFRVLPVSHLGMLLSVRVAEECGRFLRDGHFSLAS